MHEKREEPEGIALDWRGSRRGQTTAGSASVGARETANGGLGCKLAITGRRLKREDARSGEALVKRIVFSRETLSWILSCLLCRRAWWPLRRVGTLPARRRDVASPCGRNRIRPLLSSRSHRLREAKLNSEKSTTWARVEQRIIRAKGGAKAASPVAAKGRDELAAPRVQNVRIDAGSDGQRLDNFLAKVLKGVPRAHLHRVIRSGEVRVNSGRAAADTRLALGDEVRIPPVRVADRSERPEAPGREFPVVHEDDALICIDKPAGVAVHGGSGESFGVIEQLRQARPAAFLELVHRLDKDTSGLLLHRQDPAGAGRAAERPALAPAGAGDRQDLCGAGRRRLARVAQGDRRRPAQGHRERRQPARPRRRRRRRARPPLDQPGSRDAPLRRLQPARRDPEDRAHAPDPGPPERRRPCHRRRSEVRRLRAQPGAGARHVGRAAALRSHVPARAPLALHASDHAARRSTSKRRCRWNAARC